jgi:hypothetical protein
MDGLFFGGRIYGRPTSASRNRALLDLSWALVSEGKRPLAIEYCDEKGQIVEARAKSAKAGVLAYVDRDADKQLGRIPAGPPWAENAAVINDFSRVRNFLPLLRSESFGTRADWVLALRATNYDLLILDTFWHETESLTFDQIGTLRYKRIGTDRLVFGTLSLGRARDTRFYWKPEWNFGNPPFLVAADPDDPAQTVVNYWDPMWKEIVGRYMQGLVDLGVDGVVFDAVDAYLGFEDEMPLE